MVILGWCDGDLNRNRPREGELGDSPDTDERFRKGGFKTAKLFRPGGVLDGKYASIHPHDFEQDDAR